MADEIVVGAFTLAGVAVGAGLTYLADRRLWKRSQALAARLLLAEAVHHVWAETPWSEFEVDLERLRAHLDLLGVRRELLDALGEAIRECRSSIERDQDDPNIGRTLTDTQLGRYRAAADAIAAQLT